MRERAQRRRQKAGGDLSGALEVLRVDGLRVGSLAEVKSSREPGDPEERMRVPEGSDRRAQQREQAPAPGVGIELTTHAGALCVPVDVVQVEEGVVLGVRAPEDVEAASWPMAISLRARLRRIADALDPDVGNGAGHLQASFRRRTPRGDDQLARIDVEERQRPLRIDDVDGAVATAGLGHAPRHRSGRAADRSRLEDPQGVAIELEQQSVADTAPMALQLLHDRRTGRFGR